MIPALRHNEEHSSLRKKNGSLDFLVEWSKEVGDLRQDQQLPQRAPKVLMASIATLLSLQFLVKNDFTRVLPRKSTLRTWVEKNLKTICTIIVGFINHLISVLN